MGNWQTLKASQVAQKMLDSKPFKKVLEKEVEGMIEDIDQSVYFELELLNDLMWARVIQYAMGYGFWWEIVGFWHNKIERFFVTVWHEMRRPHLRMERSP